MVNPILTEPGDYTALPLEKVYYGVGSLARLPEEVDRLGGGRALIVTGHSLATLTELIHAVEGLLGARHAATFAGIRQHAPESGIAEAAQLARDCQADVLVSVGGGSPIDAAKAVALRLAQGGVYPPQIAIPTTLSAAEFSGSAGYTDEAQKSKRGISDRMITPRAIILDPQMTLPTPMWLWLSSGIRALDHAIETLYSPGYHPVNDVLALASLRDLFTYLPRCKAEPESMGNRQMCQQAAWMGYFSPASAAAAAGLSHTIGKRIGAPYDVPHGVTSCILLPHVMRYKAENEADATRLAAMARALGLADERVTAKEAALRAAEAVACLVRDLDLPARLRDVKVPEEDFERIAIASVGDTPQAADVVQLLKSAW
ncbi:MAG TPA: iron-containing alcohol dehydrogenase [Anaerolineaceae bacterium]|jgi:alcohol dehydrogenase